MSKYQAHPNPNYMKSIALQQATNSIAKYLGSSYQNNLYFVGGCCRDNLLINDGTLSYNTVIKDFDIVALVNPSKIIATMKSNGANIQNEVVFKKYQTYRFTLDGFDFEISRARTEIYNKDSRKPNVKWANTFAEDLVRRDFTINCLMICPYTKKYIVEGSIFQYSSYYEQPVSAVTVFNGKILMTPTNPETIFKDDPLRILRGIRFAVKYGFTIHKETYKYMKFCIPYLTKVSKERIKEELWKMSENKNFYKALILLDDIGLLTILFPTVSLLKNLKQGGKHEFYVFKHTIQAVKHADNFDPVVKWAAFFHDFGKAYTREKTDNKYTFYRHEELSTKLAEQYLTDLKFFEILDTVKGLVKYHMALLDKNARTQKHVRKLVLKLGTNYNYLIQLMEADLRAKTSKGTSENLFELVELGAKALTKFENNELSSPLDGNEIMETLGISPGPAVKLVKQHLQNLVLNDDLAFDDKNSAIKAAKEYYNTISVEKREI